MKLVIILICLGLERYLDIGGKLHRFTWFDAYVRRLKSVVKIDALWQKVAGLVVILVPLWFVLSLLYVLMAEWVFGLAGIIFNVVVLLYCLGPDDLYHQVQSYFQACEANDKDKAQQIQTTILNTTAPQDIAKANRAVTQAIFTQANQRLFAVLFWFIVLGPFGALFYRVVQLTRDSGSDIIKPFQAHVMQLLAILDWLPVRLIALFYTLAGNFQASFRFWLEHAKQGLSSNNALLMDCGLLAVGAKPEDVACSTLEENREAMDIIDRVLVVLLFLIAALTLVAWIA